ncbi:hypothetical protein E4K10_49360 [Streptomyces sp. T1317-0309]|nr:hypothetical protein E4K10_49360 [Streptomyces sp. T1317-0309]
MAGRARARDDDRQVTFSERGNIQGAQFHALAAIVYERARERGLGHEIPASGVAGHPRLRTLTGSSRAPTVAGTGHPAAAWSFDSPRSGSPEAR